MDFSASFFFFFILITKAYHQFILFYIIGAKAGVEIAVLTSRNIPASTRRKKSIKASENLILDRVLPNHKKREKKKKSTIAQKNIAVNQNKNRNQSTDTAISPSILNRNPDRKKNRNQKKKSTSQRKRMQASKPSSATTLICYFKLRKNQSKQRPKLNLQKKRINQIYSGTDFNGLRGA